MTTEHTVVSFRQIKKKTVQFSGRLLANYRDLCLQLPPRAATHPTYAYALSPLSRPECDSLPLRGHQNQGVISWFEFIVFRRDIVVGSLFGGHQFLGKAAPKITLRCFHQPGHQIFRHSVDRSILIDFGVD